MSFYVVHEFTTDSVSAPSSCKYARGISHINAILMQLQLLYPWYDNLAILL